MVKGRDPLPNVCYNCVATQDLKDLNTVIKQSVHFILLKLASTNSIQLTYARKFPRYVNFANSTVTYRYSENLIYENLLVCNSWRFVMVHNMLPFHDEPVIRKNIIAKILFASCSAKISMYTIYRYH